MLSPIIKWAGGKRQLLDKIIPMIPNVVGVYYEPFAGGLAVMSSLYSRKKFMKAAISDLNPELINLYVTVKDHPHSLIEEISRLEFLNNKEFYYKLRDNFNSIKGMNDMRIERAAMFLVLNRLCYNGLWRVNSKGEFNVPFGRYTNPEMVSRHHILKFSEMLQNVSIKKEDFSSCVRGAQDSDFVYFDPPYFPVSHTAKFAEYTRESFSEDDLERLLKVCRALDNRNVRFLLSNSCTNMVQDLFGEFRITIVDARRYINSIAAGRGGHKEVLIYNYDFPSRTLGFTNF